jgi:hypothetical protein
MQFQRAYLLDPSSAKVATLDVTQIGDLYSGTICLDSTPPELIDLFQQFEEMVEGQVFNIADEIEERIEEFRLRVAFENGLGTEVAGLQVYPSTKAVSFKIRQPATVPQ